VGTPKTHVRTVVTPTYQENHVRTAPHTLTHKRFFFVLQMYADNFEKPFLEQTAAFFQAEGQRMMQQTHVPEYLAHCERRFQEESDRCVQYLDACTRKPLVLCVERELLEQHTQVRVQWRLSCRTRTLTQPQLFTHTHSHAHTPVG